MKNSRENCQLKMTRVLLLWSWLLILSLFTRADFLRAHILHPMLEPPRQHDSSPQPLDIISARGFIGEMFAIRSRDGAPLTLYHLINPEADQRTLNKYPVLIAHGLSGDATQTISNSEKSRPRRPSIGRITYDEGDVAIPFMLSNNNFDVYMVDARGTNLNNRKVSSDFDPFEANRFWNFSLDEQAQLDLPTAIDFVLEQTQMDKLHFVGYSESTFFIFALLSHQPGYQDKLASVVAMAPVAYVSAIKGSLVPVLLAASLVPDEVNGNYIPQPLSDTAGAAVRRVCSERLTGATLCKALARSMVGGGQNMGDPTDLFLTAFKSTSIKALKQFHQLYEQKRFGMYDFGPVGNLRQYGQESPPNYDLGRIRLPFIILVRGSEDFLSTPHDQMILLSELGTKPYLDINLPTYDHLDFFIAKTALFDVCIPVVQSMFSILKWHTGNGQFLRNASKGSTGRIRPVEVRLPTRSRDVRVKSNLIPNLIDGVVQTKWNNKRRVLQLETDPTQILSNIEPVLNLPFNPNIQVPWNSMLV